MGWHGVCRLEEEDFRAGRLHVQWEQPSLCASSRPQGLHGLQGLCGPCRRSPGTQVAACRLPTGSHVCVEKAAL